MCCVLAFFEQVFRARVLTVLEEPLRAHGNDLPALVSALVPAVTRNDVLAVARAAVDDHADLRTATALAIGPMLEQSVALGGADADLICDGTLIDLKASSQAKLVGRDELYQLVGYLLADTPDLYRITHVGFSALRRRQRISGPPRHSSTC